MHYFNEKVNKYPIISQERKSVLTDIVKKLFIISDVYEDLDNNPLGNNLLLEFANFLITNHEFKLTLEVLDLTSSQN